MREHLKSAAIVCGVYGPLRRMYRRMFSPPSRQQFAREVHFYSSFIRQGDLCFDIGGNIGSKTEVFLALGREIRLSSVPRWMVHASGIFIPLLREVDEMMYQWDEPFVINDRRFRERFQQEPTDVDEAAAATVAWAQQHYTGSKQLGRRDV